MGEDDPDCIPVMNLSDWHVFVSEVEVDELKEYDVYADMNLRRNLMDNLGIFPSAPPASRRV